MCECNKTLCVCVCVCVCVSDYVLCVCLSGIDSCVCVCVSVCACVCVRGCTCISCLRNNTAENHSSNTGDGKVRAFTGNVLSWPSVKINWNREKPGRDPVSPHYSSLAFIGTMSTQIKSAM
ncbi:unnamed protein product [Arctogadus glacialis]